MSNEYTSFCHVVNHPLVQHKLTMVRDKNTEPHIIRGLIEEIGQLMAYEVTRDLELKTREVVTPMVKTKGYEVSDPPVLVPILRAGNALLWGMMKLLSFSPIGHIGIYRDKFIQDTVEYYFRLPQNVQGKTIFLLDPILATGDTVVAAISRLKEYEVGEIKMVTVLACKVGLERLHRAHPEVQVYTTSIEPELDQQGYILPGMGDAGDRIYGTEI